MRKPILYSEDLQEVEGYVSVPVDDYVLYYDPTRSTIDDVVQLHLDIRSLDEGLIDKFWKTVEEI